MMMMKTLAMVSILLMTSMSPILMVIAILSLSSTMMMVKWLETNNPWTPLIFTMTFLGGMMIIFMYIVSISSIKNKKNKNKQASLLVFVFLSMWDLKYGYSSNMVEMIISSYFSQYLFLCSLILMILFITTKIINSPFKALKSSS